MPRLAVLLFALPLVAVADDWVEIRTGPFHVLTNANDDRARETANLLEQLRHSVGVVVGQSEPKITWPVRVVVFKSGTARPFELARDAYIGSLAAGQPAPRAWLRRLTEILIEANTARMPRDIETGLADFFSTIEVNATRITLGRPLPATERSAAWFRVHMLQVQPDYYGKLRVLVYNLQRGVEPEPAYRNAFGKSPAEIEKAAQAYLAAGHFETIDTSGRPISPKRDFRVLEAKSPIPELALADLKLVDSTRPGDAQASYRKLLAAAPAEAHEGVAFLALRDKSLEEARKEFAAAIAAGSTNARAWVESARLQPGASDSAQKLKKAVELNPDWAEPHFVFAQTRDDLPVKIQGLKKAAELEPRNAAYWRALAEAQLVAKQFSDAAKAWAAAENASADDKERAEIRAARRAIEEQRVEHEIAERKRLEEEKRREIEKLKQAALAEVRAAEERVNRGAPAAPPDRRIVPYWEGDVPSGKLSGRLIQVDCRRGGASRLTVEDRGGKPILLGVRDPGKIVVMGSGGELTLVCGPQRPPREVTVEYFPGKDPKIAGEVATVEFVQGRAPEAESKPESPRKKLSKPK